MGAGISKKALNAKLYRILKHTQKRLIDAGVPTIYRKYQLFPDVTNVKADLAFNISYKVLRASNGEVAALPVITVQVSGKELKYENFDFENGIKAIIDAFTVVKQTVIDFRVEGQGSIYILYALTKAAKAWVSEHIPQSDETQYWAGGIVVEHRYILDIIDGIKADGLTFEKQ